MLTSFLRHPLVLLILLSAASAAMCSRADEGSASENSSRNSGYTFSSSATLGEVWVKGDDSPSTLVGISTSVSNDKITWFACDFSMYTPYNDADDRNSLHSMAYADATCTPYAFIPGENDSISVSLFTVDFRRSIENKVNAYVTLSAVSGDFTVLQRDLRIAKLVVDVVLGSPGYTAVSLTDKTHFRGLTVGEAEASAQLSRSFFGERLEVALSVGCRDTISYAGGPGIFGATELDIDTDFTLRKTKDGPWVKIGYGYSDVQVHGLPVPREQSQTLSASGDPIVLGKAAAESARKASGAVVRGFKKLRLVQ